MGDLTYCEGNGTATAHGSPIDLTIFEKKFIFRQVVHSQRRSYTPPGSLCFDSSIDTSTKRNSFTIIDKPEKK